MGECSRKCGTWDPGYKSNRPPPKYDSVYRVNQVNCRQSHIIRLFFATIVMLSIMKSISIDCQNSIIALLSQGVSVKKTAQRLGLAPSTVSKYKNRHRFMTIAIISGRPNKITKSKRRLIQRKILTGALQTAAEVHRNLIKDGYDLSYRSI
jgi:hypothetical protein